MALARIVLTAPAPMHALTIGVTGAGLALAAFSNAPGSIERAAARLGVDVVDGDPDHPAGVQLREYLVGERRAFDLPLDWSLTGGVQRSVLQALHDTVPFGSTVTYGELAARSALEAGHQAPRDVGSIMASNPLVIVVPCHRVMAADGLGGFGGGRQTKEWLLALEGVLTLALDFG